MPRKQKTYQQGYDDGFIKAIKLIARGPKNRRFWNTREKRLAAKALRPPQTEGVNVFDRTVVISLRRYPQRLAAFQSKLPADWPFRTPEVFYGFDAERVTPPPHWTINRGQWGCLESHRAVIGHALSDGLGSMLIMEDDCEFLPGAAAKMIDAIHNVPRDWDCLMFGSQLPPWSTIEEFGPGLQRSKGAERMHSYALSNRGMLGLYRQLSRPMNMPCDFTLGHWSGTPGVYVFRLNPPIAIQGESYSVCDGEHYPARAWDAAVDVRSRDFFSVPVISLKCPPAVARRLLDEGLIYTGYPKDPRGYEFAGGDDEKLADNILCITTIEPARLGPLLMYIIEKARAYGRAVAALWHPRELVKCDGAIPIEAQTFTQAKAAILSANNQGR